MYCPVLQGRFSQDDENVIGGDTQFAEPTDDAGVQVLLCGEGPPGKQGDVDVGVVVARPRGKGKPLWPVLGVQDVPIVLRHFQCVALGEVHRLNDGLDFVIGPGPAHVDSG